MKNIFLLAGVALLTGCAAVEQSNIRREESRLAEAGFRVMPADTAHKKAILASLTPYKIETASKNGLEIYRYADPGKQILYVGGPREYAAYRDILVSDRARAATNLSQTTSSNWSVMGPMVW